MTELLDDLLEDLIRAEKKSDEGVLGISGCYAQFGADVACGGTRTSCFITVGPVGSLPQIAFVSSTMRGTDACRVARRLLPPRGAAYLPMRALCDAQC
eukprot:74791-Rhodomonas_salina.1